MILWVICIDVNFMHRYYAVPLQWKKVNVIAFCMKKRIG